ncbi:hypothetical protein [Nocardioides endophyticus]|uniref:hypothetical protein n=1 Tax=Nocardioides endophyticus TaxID=1353775 RepID=UPI003CD0B911
MVEFENIRRGEHLRQVASRSDLSTPATSLLEDVLERGRTAESIRPDVEAIDVHMLIGAYASSRSQPTTPSASSSAVTWWPPKSASGTGACSKTSWSPGTLARSAPLRGIGPHLIMRPRPWRRTVRGHARAA